MTETLFFDASSDHNPRLNVQTRNDVDANERRTVEALSIVRKDIANISIRSSRVKNVDRDNARIQEIALLLCQIKYLFCVAT